MTKEQLISTFERLNEAEFLKTANMADRYRASTHTDLCAFILLDKLVPTGKVEHMPGSMHDMVESAEHNQIWLRTGLEELAVVATDEDVKALIQCGVMLDNDTESLSMFV